MKDARRITKTFVTGLVCPFDQNYDVDGDAYVLPSDILPIAILPAFDLNTLSTIVILQMRAPAMYISHKIKKTC